MTVLSCELDADLDARLWAINVAAVLEVLAVRTIFSLNDVEFVHITVLVSDVSLFFPSDYWEWSGVIHLPVDTLPSCRAAKCGGFDTESCCWLFRV